VNPVTAAVLASLSDSFAELRAALQDVSAEGLNWRPGEQTNSIAAQIAHALDSSGFWVEAAARRDADRVAYLGRRENAFHFGADRFALFEMIDEAESKAAEHISSIEAQSLAERREWPQIAGQQPRTAAWCLVHAADHLREHLGSIMLTRQIWLQRQQLPESLHRR
jgi:uncharacterized damage-inducible protein DinB